MIVYLFQAHFTCIVPPYMHPNITEPVTVRLFVVSSGKTSEPQHFVYTPVNGAMPSGKLALILFKHIFKCGQLESDHLDSRSKLNTKMIDDRDEDDQLRQSR